MSTIGYRTNIAALQVGRQQGKSSSQLGAEYNQLSSGLRINKASDDSGGLAVASSLKADSRIANQARRNADDGISLLTLAESGFAAARSVVSRMGELATQAAQSTTSTAQREALSSEFGALQDELFRIQDSLRFNGVSILQGQGGTSLSDVTPHGAVDGFVSADGRYTTWQTAAGDIYQADSITGNTVTIASGAMVGVLDVSSFGERVVYGDGSTRDMGIWDRETDSTITISTGAGTVTDVQISADGSTAFMMNDPSGSSALLAKAYEAESGNFISEMGTLEDFKYTVETVFEVSEDGSKFLIGGQSTATGASAEAHVFDVASGSLEYNTSTGDSVLWAAIANDGTLFLSSQGNLDGSSSSHTTQIFSTSDSGSSFQNLTQSLTGGLYTPSMQLTDGERTLTFQSQSNPFGANAQGEIQLFKVSTEGEGLRQLSSFSASPHVVSISDDGLSFLDTDANIQHITPVYSLSVFAGKGSHGSFTAGIASLDSAVRAMGNMSIENQQKAEYSAEILERGSDGISVGVGKVAAGISRTESARRSSATSSTEFSDAKSRIEDIDVATALANSVKLEALSNSQTALFAQVVNIIPEIALTLLESADAASGEES